MNVIQVSGGIDSMAMLHLLRPLWPESTVMWCNSGAAYDSTKELMKRIADEVPHFVVVYGQQPRVIAERGYPADVVPVKFSREGEIIFGEQPMVFQSYMECCFRSLWIPVEAACRELGAKVIYRGQRQSEGRRNRLLTPGCIRNGVRYEFPLQDWSRERVFEYAHEHCPHWIAESYSLGEKTSRDCWNCTAYRDDNVERVRNLPEPQRDEVTKVLAFWRQAVREEINVGV